MAASSSWTAALQLRKFRDNGKVIGNNYLKDMETIGSRSAQILHSVAYHTKVSEDGRKIRDSDNRIEGKEREKEKFMYNLIVMLALIPSAYIPSCCNLIVFSTSNSRTSFLLQMRNAPSYHGALPESFPWKKGSVMPYICVIHFYLFIENSFTFIRHWLFEILFFFFWKEWNYVLGIMWWTVWHRRPIPTWPCVNSCRFPIRLSCKKLLSTFKPPPHLWNLYLSQRTCG